MSIELRPWGWFENLLEEDRYKVYKVKRLVVSPNQSISLQYHFHRKEYWIVVDGNGELTHKDYKKNIEIGDTVFIDKKDIHRLTAGNDGIIVIETQLGLCDENDIVRLEDHYGRVE